MRTFGTDFLDKILVLSKSLNDISKNDYSDQDLIDIITKCGVFLENYLKSVVFPSESKRKTLNELIDKLTALGLSDDETKKIHTIRKLYNDVKHDPTVKVSIINIQTTIDTAVPIFQKINSTKTGIIDRPTSITYKNIFWIGAWDHYVGSDTEIHIILPIETNHYLGPNGIEIVNIELSAWDKVKEELAVVGVLLPGRGIIPDSQIKILTEDEDSLSPLVFEGDYRDLIKVLTKYEKEDDLLPFLKRSADYSSMLNAFAFSAIDIACSNNFTFEVMKQEILKQAMSVYAVPTTYHLADQLAHEFTLALQSLCSTNSDVNGPSWVTNDIYEKEKETAKYVSTSFYFLINSENTLRMKKT